MSLLITSGQCGNQLGATLNAKLFNELSRAPEHTPDLDIYFRGGDSSINLFTSEKGHTQRGKYTPRTVCIDTEPKVINDIVNKPVQSGQPWAYDPHSVVYRHGGAGNNWAVGYQMCSGEFLEECLDKVSREMEHCDVSPVITIVQSVAGGTGSGLGTAMTEQVGDLYSHLARMNIVVAPYHFGEVVVQNYNAVLSFAKISVASNAMVVFENEIAHDLSKNMRGVEQPSIGDLNDTIGSVLAPFMLPKKGVSSVSGRARRSGIGDDIMHLASNPRYRFLDVRVTPLTHSQSVEFTYDSWTSILNTLQAMQITGAHSERGLTAAARQVSATGKYVFCYTAVLPSFFLFLLFAMTVSVSLLSISIAARQHSLTRV
jgi:hypothetical protein